MFYKTINCLDNKKFHALSFVFAGAKKEFSILVNPWD